ncbi:N-6 DNA methylase [Streptacidiphilus sp. N1-3]|uniref:N-6 DNA methylase n=1 Tax=Streptacidiphilus alkalitolerans TaxID=3342712 RepID=A0ABV6WTA7_9ACTN
MDCTMLYIQFCRSTATTRSPGMSEDPTPTPLVTAAEISRLAQVTRATVSNWRKRHDDFPAPVGGTDSSPAYDLEAVTAWLAANERLPEANPIDGLRTAVRMVPADAVGDVLPLVLAASRLNAGELDRLRALDGAEFDLRCEELIVERAPEVPRAPGGHIQDSLGGSDLRRAVVECVRVGRIDALLSVLEYSQRDTGPARGQYPTPEPLAALLADLATANLDEPVNSGFDPACGTGALLAALRGYGVEVLAGQDLLAPQAAQTMVMLALGTDAPSDTLSSAAGDSLRADAFPTLRADVVVCNPPYGDTDWGQDELAYDERWAYGVPAAKESELAWLQHCLAHLRPGGRAVLLLPPAVAGRPSGRRIRAELVRRGAIRAVVSLPAGAAPPAHITLHAWVLERPVGELASVDPVLFVDASRDADGSPVRLSGVPETSGGRLKAQWQALHESVLGAWRAFEDRPGLARVVPAIDLLDDTVDLTPQRHVPAAAHAQNPDEIARGAQAAWASLRTLAAGLAQPSHGPDADNTAWPLATRPEPRAWRMATVGDLLRGGALALVRGASSVPRGTGDAQGGERPVLMAKDLRDGDGPSETVASVGDRMKLSTEVARGDIVISEIVHGRMNVLVAGALEEGALLGTNLIVLRPDTQRLDPHFLAGFLATPDNLGRAVSGSTIMRLDPRRLQVPLIPLTEQHRYGESFQALRQLSAAARQIAALGEDAARQLTWGLTSGALVPPTDPKGP